MSEQSKPTYETGANFWRDTAVSYGAQEALGICGRYLDTQMGMEQPPEEHRFCREMFTAMYEDANRTAKPARLVYPYDFQKANDRVETSYYHDSRKTNAECARAIDAAIGKSCYKRDFYNLDLAAMKVIHDYGFERVNMVLANDIGRRRSDGRFSDANKQWAKGYEVNPIAFDGAHFNSHAILIDGFATHARNLYAELGAERFALPGRQPEAGDIIHGYEIVRAIEFDTDRGFVIGLNPNAANQFVCWQYTTENGARDYYWGNYADEFPEAAQNYLARVIVHMNGGEVREKQRALNFEKGAEQNYNMVDGLVNNRPVPKPDLTDGQTYEEIKELIPETLPENRIYEETPEIDEAHHHHPHEPNEAELNTAAWLAVTASSRFRWVEDDIFRLNGRGAMYYTGGEDGIYMRINNDGKLEAGRYEGAIPHIGEAFFHPAVVRQFDSFSDAFKAAMEVGGKQFLLDMFGGGERQPLVKITGKDAPEEKPSVMKQIRNAQFAPKQPPKETPGLGKKKTEPDL